VALGRRCVVGAGASLECTLAGDDVVIHAGARIGGEGFGFLPRADGAHKIPQLGRVILQNGVEIGANTSVDRGTLADTVVGEGTKIDNQVQVGHNVRIGRHCQIAGRSALSGSAALGDFVLIGGAGKIGGFVHLGDHAVVYANAGVTKSFAAGARLAGFPARDVKQWHRQVAAIARLGRARNKED
jgi:UDP-3-O-[3-hydroxymyristoyl] glucosamine N-acyltransferase